MGYTTYEPHFRRTKRSFPELTCKSAQTLVWPCLWFKYKSINLRVINSLVNGPCQESLFLNSTLVSLCGMGDLISQTRDGTHASCSGSAEPRPLDHQESPIILALPGDPSLDLPLTQQPRAHTRHGGRKGGRSCACQMGQCIY